MKDISVSSRGEIFIDRRIEDVWRSVTLEVSRWAPTVEKAELVSGEWDKQGRVIMITKKEGLDIDPFYLEAVRMDPCKQLVNKFDTDQVYGFNDISLIEIGGKTKVIYSKYFSYKIEIEPLSSQEKSDDTRQSLYLGPLKEYVENNY